MSILIEYALYIYIYTLLLIYLLSKGSEVLEGAGELASSPLVATYEVPCLSKYGPCFIHKWIMMLLSWVHHKDSGVGAHTRGQ